MMRDDIVALAEGFIAETSDPRGWDKKGAGARLDTPQTHPAHDQIFDMTYESPEDLWEIILEVLRRTEDMHVLSVLAAGPLENYLAKCGDRVIERVEAQAQADPRFKQLLGGVWRNEMTDDVWARVCACRGDAW